MRKCAATVPHAMRMLPRYSDCLGRNFAKLELRLLLAVLLRRYDFSLPANPVAIKESVRITRSSDSGVWLSLRRRPPPQVPTGTTVGHSPCLRGEGVPVWCTLVSKLAVTHGACCWFGCSSQRPFRSHVSVLAVGGSHRHVPVQVSAATRSDASGASHWPARSAGSRVWTR